MEPTVSATRSSIRVTATTTPTGSPSGAGQGDKVTVKPSDTIAEVLDNEVKHLISKRWLTAGEYALALPRASENELDPLVSD
jgi:hypothetical protein